MADVVRTYLQLESPEQLVSVAPRPAGVVLHELTPCPPSVFLGLYREVGARFHWVDRLAWSNEQLATYLGGEGLRVFVARAGLEDDGFFELLRHPDGSIEITCFGLLARAQGRGIGKWLLVSAAQVGWEWGATRIWLHTCTLDASAALPNYLARGFAPYRIERYQQELGVSA